MSETIGNPFVSGNAADFVTLINKDKKQDEPPVEPTTPTEPAEPTEPVTPPVEPTEPTEPVTPTEEPTYKWSDLKNLFGDDADGLETLLNKYKETTQKAQKLNEVETKIKEYEDVLPKLTNPITSPKAAKIQTFFEATGIDDENVVAFVGKDAEALKKTPVDMLVLDEVIKRPDLLKTNTFESLRQMIADKHGVTTDVTIDDIPPSMRWDINTIAGTLQEKLNVAPKEYNPFAAKQAELQEQRQQFEQLRNQVQPRVVEAANKLTHVEFPLEDGGTVKIEVSQDLRSKVAQTLDGYLANLGYQGVTDEGIAKSLPDLASRLIDPSEIVKEVQKAISAAAQKKALDEIHNPQKVVRNDGTQPQVTQPSEVATWLKERIS